jgi:hypothetical protein
MANLSQPEIAAAIEYKCNPDACFEEPMDMVDKYSIEEIVERAETFLDRAKILDSMNLSEYFVAQCLSHKRDIPADTTPEIEYVVDRYSTEDIVEYAQRVLSGADSAFLDDIAIILVELALQPTLPIKERMWYARKAYKAHSEIQYAEILSKVVKEYLKQ